MQQQLQVKVVSLHQAQDRLEDRAKQHRQLLEEHTLQASELARVTAEHTLQASELARVTAELDSSKAAAVTAERQLSDSSGEVCGECSLSDLYRS